MPSKKKKYNSRFPPGRIKKIMQTDEEVGKVAQAVPVIISRALELFVESLLTRAVEITSARNAKTLTPSHMKQCILSESRFDFLKEFVKTVPDLVGDTDDCPGPSGGPFLASSSMEESNPCSEPYSSTEHTNGVLPIKVDPDVYAGIQDVPLNLATTSPLHCNKSTPSAASSTADLDEDYDV